MSLKILLQFSVFFTISLLMIGCSSEQTAKENFNTTSVVEQESTILMSDVAKPRSPISPITFPTSVSANHPQVAMSVVLAVPIKVGDVSVSGTGPFDLPIKIYEVAKTADLLAETTIAKDGTFFAVLSRPLLATERVGIVLGNLEGTSFKYHDFKDISIREVPVYGYILADVSVQP